MMKHLLTILLTILFLPPVWSQPIKTNSPVIEYSGNASVGLVDTDLDYLYILFPDVNGSWYISETLPTPTALINTSIKRKFTYNILGDLYLHIKCNEGSGMSSAESDSLALWIKPLTYNPASNTFMVIEGDSTFIVFDEADNYTANSADYFDWDDATVYGTLLTSELYPTCGFLLCLHQKNYTSGTSSVSIWFSCLLNRRR
jgi:hypothetical protein